MSTPSATRKVDRLRLVVLAVGLLTAVWSALALGARATNGAQTTADEPQYLLSALSLWEDHSLEITDELAERRHRPFHEAELPVQTEPVDGTGRLVSPHDPLLPLLLAVPMGLGGWVGAKLALAAVAGALAGLLVWIAVRRLAVPIPAAALVVGAFAATAPLSAYATQVYPEVPAALAVAVGIAALTGPLGARGQVAVGLAVVALPWLGVKYAGVAAVLALLALASLWSRGNRREAAGLAAGLALAGAAYVLAHRAWYGGWTVYAAGDHFVDGELSVVGTQPDHLGRSRRVVGLLLDRGFGLAAWSPAYLLAVPAIAALARRRPPAWVVLLAPLAAGWATATWVALTMHGWWWPGRQVVVVAPCLVLVVAWWTAQLGRRVRAVVAVLGAVGVLLWGWLVVEVLDGARTLIVDFEATTNPVYRLWRTLLPDYRTSSAGTWALHAVWLVVLALLARAGWRSVSPPAGDRPDPTFTAPPGPINRRSSTRVPV